MQQERTHRLGAELDGVQVADFAIGGLPGQHAEVFGLGVHVLGGEGQAEESGGVLAVAAKLEFGEGAVGEVAGGDGGARFAGLAFQIG